MASTYPGAPDTFTDPGPNLGTPGREHSSLHTELAEGIAAVQSTLGANPQGPYFTVGDRITDLGIIWPVDPEGVVVSDRLAQTEIWDPLHAPWIDWTPNAAQENVSTGVGSFNVRYKKIGATVHVAARFDFGAGSAVTGTVAFALPFAPVWDAVGSTAFLIPGFNPLGGSSCYGQASNSVCFIMWDQNSSNVWDASGPLNSGNIDGSLVTAQLTYETADVTPGSLA